MVYLNQEKHKKYKKKEKLIIIYLVSKTLKNIYKTLGKSIYELGNIVLFKCDIWQDLVSHIYIIYDELIQDLSDKHGV